MTIFILTDSDGGLFNDHAGRGRVHAYKTFEGAQERLMQLMKAGVDRDIHIREFSRRQYRYTVEVERGHEGLRNKGNTTGRREEGH